MLKELDQQIKDIQAGSTSELPAQYGHAIGVIAQVGQLEALDGKSEEDQIRVMREIAEDQVLLFGPRILDFLRPELRELIKPERLDQLTKIHEELKNKQE